MHTYCASGLLPQWRRIIHHVATARCSHAPAETCSSWGYLGRTACMISHCLCCWGRHSSGSRQACSWTVQNLPRSRRSHQACNAGGFTSEECASVPSSGMHRCVCARSRNLCCTQGRCVCASVVERLSCRPSMQHGVAVHIPTPRTPSMRCSTRTWLSTRARRAGMPPHLLYRYKPHGRSNTQLPPLLTTNGMQQRVAP